MVTMASSFNSVLSQQEARQPVHFLNRPGNLYNRILKGQVDMENNPGIGAQRPFDSAQPSGQGEGLDEHKQRRPQTICRHGRPAVPFHHPRRPYRRAGTRFCYRKPLNLFPGENFRAIYTFCFISFHAGACIMRTRMDGRLEKKKRIPASKRRKQSKGETVSPPEYN